MSNGVHFSVAIPSHRFGAQEEQKWLKSNENVGQELQQRLEETASAGSSPLPVGWLLFLPSLTCAQALLF